MFWGSRNQTKTIFKWLEACLCKMAAILEKLNGYIWQCSIKIGKLKTYIMKVVFPVFKETQVNVIANFTTSPFVRNSNLINISKILHWSENRSCCQAAITSCETNWNWSHNRLHRDETEKKNLWRFRHLLSTQNKEVKYGRKPIAAVRIQESLALLRLIPIIL